MKTVAFMAAMAAASFNSQALERLIVEFNGDSHKVVARYQIAPKPLINVKHQLHKAQVSVQFQPSASATLVSIADPRIIRAPLAKTGVSGHEAIILQQSGSYVIDIPSNSDLSHIKLLLPSVTVGNQSMPAKEIVLSE